MINLVGRTEAVKAAIETGQPVLRFLAEGQAPHDEMKMITATACRLGHRVALQTCRLVTDDAAPVKVIQIKRVEATL